MLEGMRHETKFEIATEDLPVVFGTGTINARYAATFIQHLSGAHTVSAEDIDTRRITFTLVWEQDDEGIELGRARLAGWLERRKDAISAVILAVSQGIPEPFVARATVEV